MSKKRKNKSIRKSRPNLVVYIHPGRNPAYATLYKILSRNEHDQQNLLRALLTYGFEEAKERTDTWLKQDGRVPFPIQEREGDAEDLVREFPGLLDPITGKVRRIRYRIYYRDEHKHILDYYKQLPDGTAHQVFLKTSLVCGMKTDSFGIFLRGHGDSVDFYQQETEYECHEPLALSVRQQA